jgi:hypothetical protein
MSRFHGPLTITANPDGRTYTVHAAFRYQSDVLDRTVVIPAGFVTDGASVPRLFWNLIPPLGKYGQAAVVHDYLYRWQAYSRRRSDDALLEAMWVSGCARWQYAAIYLAVRLFGAPAWKADQQNPLPPALLPLVLFVALVLCGCGAHPIKPEAEAAPGGLRAAQQPEPATQPAPKDAGPGYSLIPTNEVGLKSRISNLKSARPTQPSAAPKFVPIHYPPNASNYHWWAVQRAPTPAGPWTIIQKNLAWPPSTNNDLTNAITGSAYFRMIGQSNQWQ